MKKIYRVVITIIVILSLLSLNVLSANLSDDYVFTQYWWNEVITNSVLSYSNDNTNYITVNKNQITTDWSYGIRYNEMNGENLYQYLSSRWNGANSGTMYYQINLPFNISMKKDESFSFDLVVGYELSQGQSITSRNIYTYSLYGSNSFFDTLNVSSELIDNCYLGEYGSASVTKEFFDQCIIYHISYTAQQDINLNRISLRFGIFGVRPTNMTYGVVYSEYVSPDTIIGSTYIPSDELKELQNIGEELYNMGLQLNTLNSQLISIQQQIQQIYDRIGVENSTTNNYYQTITNASQEDKDKIEELQNQLATTEEQLKEVTEKLSLTEDSFPDEEVLDNIQQNTISSITDYTSGAEVSSIMNIFFGNEFIMTLLVMSFGLATVSFILYGKKG